MSELRFDLLIRNATLLTAEPEEPIVRNASLGVIADRIAWIGTALPPLARGGVELDLAGRVVTPGFVNVHTHSALSMVRGVAADLGFAPSYTRGIPNALDLVAEDAIALTRLGALEALLAGSTLIGEHFVHVDACVPEIAKLGMRVHASVRLHDVDFRKVADSGRWEFDARLGEELLQRNLALHANLHGGEHGRIAVQFAAHAADTCSQPYLRRVANAAQAVGAVVNTHLAQSVVELERVRARTGRTSVQVFEEAGLLNDHLLCGHCIYLEDADIERMVKAGVHVVHIPKCNAASGRLAPTPRLKAAGLNITLATDTQHADMVELMRWALATARVQTGGVDADWQPQHVFAMATINAARAVGLADDLGSLKVGKKADLVVFDFRRPHLVPAINPLGNLVHTALGRDVEMVFVDGRCVVSDGRPTHVDMDAVLADARSAAAQLWRKAAA